MSQSELSETLQKVQRLSETNRRLTPSPQTLHHAQEFISQIYVALMAQSPQTWQSPAVEVGEGGVIAFLWRDGQRELSLLVGSAGDGTWYYTPGRTFGEIVNLDFTDRLTGGTSGPDTFALQVWLPWARGEDPVAV